MARISEPLGTAPVCHKAKFLGYDSRVLPLDAPRLLALSGSAFAAGIMNSMAGGGTILTFPALLFAGEPALVANATSTVSLLPGLAGSMAGYREEVRQNRRWLTTLLVPSLLGGLFGSVLLLATPERTFERLAPYLVLFATLLFLLQHAVRREASDAGPEGATRRRLAVAWIFQLAVATYGGYFGAGIGILMLAALGFLGFSDIHAMNGLKNFFAICINVVAASYFIFRGYVDWRAALLMAACAVAGGYGGARLARRIGRERVRKAVVVIGFAVAALLLWRQGRP
jgi:uncharacterized membrane protein YfcA